ncbi:MAG TPA: winged helix-turn-helix domain-containing protein [Flavobacteriaceae bacterium]|nr:winged helix-turn-helix domain-containing protein [Flavobacteriaceae bacterium]
MMTEQELQTQKDQLIELVGVHVEKEKNMAPLAARILATLIVTCKQGATFEQLVADLGASKSTICTHLNNLEASGLIDYFTKPGDRKRYFIMTPNRLIQFIDEKVAKWEDDKTLHKELINYKTNVNEVYKNEPEKQCELNFHYNFLTFLDEATKVFTKLKNNLNEKHLINHNR